MEKNIGYTLMGLFLLLLHVDAALPRNPGGDDLEGLLPEVMTWEQTELPQLYFPETLFEYINGAAEIYLSYEFHQLIVAQFIQSEGESNVSVEIYDMGNNKNSFGIYSAERFPDNHFIDMGVQGYLEEGLLNFLAGRYYVKLMCFECEEQSDRILAEFARDIVSRVKGEEGFPSLLSLLPRNGLLLNSEKFILRNFMGHRFLHHGYLANYQLPDLEFDCFLIQGDSQEDAVNMIEQFLKTRNQQDVQKISQGYRIKDKYYHQIYLGLAGRYICGVMKIKDGFEEIGEKYLLSMIQSMQNKDN